jgi:hypothetical protein
MFSDPQQIEDTVSLILRVISKPFWQKLEFWITIVIAVTGVIFSILAFAEARKAKRAATEAGRTVKIQTITIELTEVSQKLDKLRPNIPFNEARDMLTEISRRLRRIISPFQADPDLKCHIDTLREVLTGAKESLNSVRPTDPANEETPYTVYYAIESDFASINDCVADLLGLFEKKTINIGDDNVAPKG